MKFLVGSRTALPIMVLFLFAFAVATENVSAQTQYITLSGGKVRQIVVPPGKTVTVRTSKAFGDIVVGNSDVADVIPLSDTSLYVQGRRSGFTNISIYDVNKQLLGVIDIRVRLNYGEIRKAIRDAVPSARIRVTNVNNKVRLSGLVKDAVDLRRVLEIAEQYSADPVINSIRVRDAQQVLLKVRVLEVLRTSGRDLGIDLIGSKSGNTKFVTGAPLLSNQLPFGTFIGKLLEVAGLRVDVVINALEAKGAARRLANPSLIAMSGSDADFQVGGEVPISKSVIGQNGNVATETAYRPFGVRLRFTPIVLDDGLINLEIKAEVSDIDETINVNGQPGFITRKAETTVELRDGQSFAIAGLLQATNDRSIEQLPWIGQLPVIGALFRSTSFQKRETDLVIVVSPRIVRPAAPGEPLRSPLDTARSSDDVELFLLGMLEVDEKMIGRYRDGEGIVGPYGHIIDLEFNDALVIKK